jgi:hypothetical protein
MDRQQKWEKLVEGAYWNLVLPSLLKKRGMNDSTIDKIVDSLISAVDKGEDISSVTFYWPTYEPIITDSYRRMILTKAEGTTYDHI